MTIIEEENLSCALCGRVSRQPVMVSSSFFGSSHLDTRAGPGAPLQACPACGYVALDLTHSGGADKDAAVIEVVRSDSYQDQLHHKRYPEHIDHLICRAVIMERAGTRGDGGWAWMHAAWACDDFDYRGDGARVLREHAVNCLRAALVAGQAFATSRAAEHAILTDLLRRLAWFGEAQTACARGLAAEPDGATRRVLDFQKELIGRGDTDAWNLDEVTGGGADD